MEAGAHIPSQGCRACSATSTSGQETSLSSPKLPEEMTLVGSEISVGWDAENLEALLKPSKEAGKGNGKFLLPAPLSASAAPRQGCEMVEDGEHPSTRLGMAHEQLAAPNPPIPRLPAAKRKNNFQKAKNWAKVAAGIHRAIPS